MLTHLLLGVKHFLTTFACLQQRTTSTDEHDRRDVLSDALLLLCFRVGDGCETQRVGLACEVIDVS